MKQKKDVINQMKLTKIIESIKELVNEARITFDKGSLKIAAMDPCNVSMVVLDYKIKTDIEGSYGINLLNLAKVLIHCNNNPEFQIVKCLNSKEGYDDFILKVVSGKTAFNLPVIDMDEKESKIPDLKLNGPVNIPSDRFRKIVKASNTVSEIIIFDEKGIFAKGDIAGYEYEIKLPAARSRYSIEYLMKMALTSLSGTVSLEWDKDYPLRITYQENIADLNYKLQFILAPRVMDE